MGRVPNEMVLYWPNSWLFREGDWLHAWYIQPPLRWTSARPTRCTKDRNLQEFYDARIAGYSQCKRAMLAAMEHMLAKIANQARFITVSMDELKIAKHRMAEVVRDLKECKFEPWLPRKDGNTLKFTDAVDEDEEEGKQKQTDGKTDAVMGGVQALQKKSGKDLWYIDLDALEGHMDDYCSEYERNVSKMRQMAEAKYNKVKLGAKTKGKKRSPRTTSTPSAWARSRWRPTCVCVWWPSSSTAI